MIQLQEGPVNIAKTEDKEELDLTAAPGTFGILEVREGKLVSFSFFDSDLRVLNEIELKQETEDEEVDPIMRYLVIGILILCILGFLFFIINWIRCFLSRPRSHEDDENSSDSEDDERNKGKKMELKKVLD